MTIAGFRRAFREFQKNLDLVHRVEEIAREKGCKPSQLALAWVLGQGDNIVPIPGTKRRKYLEENVAALDVQLAAEDLRRLAEIFPQGCSRGNALSGTHDEDREPVAKTKLESVIPGAIRAALARGENKSRDPLFYLENPPQITRAAIRPPAPRVGSAFRSTPAPAALRPSLFPAAVQA
jgi:hypothetical protein